MTSRLRKDRRGQIGLVFGLSAITIVTGLGSGVDLLSAYSAQQKLTEVASLTCQYSKRSSVSAIVENTVTGVENIVGSVVPGSTAAGSVLTYITSVTSFLNTTLTAQNFPYKQTTASPFSYTANGAATVTVTATVPTTFMRLVGATTIPVGAVAHCYDTLTKPPTTTGGSTVFTESFETNSTCTAGGFCWTKPNGQSGQAGSAIPVTNAFPSTPGYTGSSGTQWYITGYCIEVDQKGQILANVPAGTRSAELDCDNGSGTAGNSAITTKVYLAAGNYELRYSYAGRVDYPDYDPAYICGSTAADTSWANDTNSVGGSNALRTNQINVYLDRATATSAPMHTTIDGTQQLAGSAMIDTCVYAQTWIQRSVRITVTSPDYYWVTFAADGQNDSYGGQLDNIMLCVTTCSGSVQDNFPTAWTPASNGGSNVVLFEDTFESPTYTDNTGVSVNSNGNLNNSVGTSGTSASGWPSLAASGWATAPQNQIFYNTAQAAQGSQNVWLASTTGSRNRLMGRPFLLVPGFYNLSYKYVSEAIYPLVVGTYCGATPSAANMNALTGSGVGVSRIGAVASSGAYNAATVAAFIASSQLASYPIGGGALNSTTSYMNPDGTTTTTPKVAPDAISLTSYTPSTTSALLDICGYSPLWTTRNASNFEITKTGYYWLHFSSQMAGTASWWGGAIDDVKLTALGSPAMASPPSSPVVVPAAGAQASSTVTANGYYIVADPLTFPAPVQ